MSGRDSILIYKSFYEAGKVALNDEQFGKYIKLILEYGFYGVPITDTGDAIIDSLMVVIKPLLDANERNYQNGKKGAMYGKRGGRPKKNPDGVNNKTPVGLESKTPNDNVNDNVNDNDNDNENNKPSELYPEEGIDPLKLWEDIKHEYV